MNVTIKMFSIATIIIWIIIILFSVTAVLSVMNLNVETGELQMFPSSKGIIFSLPFSINNGGYYEIADLNLTTRVTDTNGTVFDQTVTFVPSIPQGTYINESHTITIDLDTIMSMDLAPLLLNDSSFNLEIFVELNFARVVPAQVSTNITIPWGAPLADFSIGDITVSSHNITHNEASIPVNFENHAILDMQGRLKLEVYNDSDEYVMSGEKVITAPSQQTFADRIIAYPRIEESTRLTDTGRVLIVFETPMFNFELWENYD